MKTEAKLLLSDFRFWLLFFIINMSGNLSFGYFFPDRLTIIILFVFLATLIYISHQIDTTTLLFVSCFAIILLLQCFFLSHYSLQSSIHFLMKIFTGCVAAVIIGDKFLHYYKIIMFFLCVVSLLCFALNCFGVVIPYVSVSSSSIDGGQVIRVSSLVYTQLYNVEHSTGLTLRNCGPFWEPGAFQGFVNLALLFEIFHLHKQNKLISVPLIIYVVTILTTISTGGYVTMFVILAISLIFNPMLQPNTKLTFIMLVLFVFAFLFFHLDFLGDKIIGDVNHKGGRLNFDFTNIGYIQTIIGNGLDPDSFLNSSLNATGSVIMLINYTGLLGGCVFYIFLMRKLTITSLILVIVATMILMNEPFLTAGPFWWSLPILSTYVNNVFEEQTA